MARTDARRPAAAGRVAVDRPDADTIALSGALTFATAAVALAEGSRALASGHPTRLDLGGIRGADSAGLACVIALAARARRAGHALEVVHWPVGLRALAEVCGVVTLLQHGAGTA